MKKSILSTIAIILAISMVAVFMMAGCNQKATPETAAAAETTQATAAETTQATTAETAESSVQTAEILLKDGIGNEIKLDGPAEKIIVFVPSALEIIDALGAIHTVAGVDNWSVDMGEPLAAGLEGFGDFSGLNMEKIAETDPDIIIGLIGWSEEDIQKLAELGIAIYIVDTNTIDEVYTEIMNMGKITGKESEAEELAENLRNEVEAIVSKTASIAVGERPKVFYEVWNDPLMSAGADTFINELIEYAGGINIVAAAGLKGWPEFSVESLIQEDPDLIIAPMSMAFEGPDVILSDTRFAGMQAIANERVYIVPDNPVSRPSQNLIKGLKMFAQAIHPEIFGEFEVLY